MASSYCPERTESRDGLDYVDASNWMARVLELFCSFSNEGDPRKPVKDFKDLKFYFWVDH